MVDVGDKSDTVRIATAEGHRENGASDPRADPPRQREERRRHRHGPLAGIMAAKQTANLIPLCHPLMLTKVSVDIAEDHALPGLRVTATAKLTGRPASRWRR